MSTSRETVRDQLVTELGVALIGTGLPCKTVVGSKVTALAGLTPLVSVLSSGSLRERATFQGDIPTFSLELQVWVLQATEGWTNAQAEDALDTIESLIAGVVQTKRNNGENIDYAGRTTVLEVSVAGVPYYLERIPVNVRLNQS